MKDNYSKHDYDFDIFSENDGYDDRRDVRRRPPARPSKRSHKRRTRIRIMMVSGALVILLLFILLIVGIVNLFVPHSTIVENIQASQVTADSVTLSWDKIGKAEGYNIYQMQSGADGYSKAASVEGADTMTCAVSGLEQATIYNFCVKAYYEDTESPEVIPLENVCTLPEKPEINRCSLDNKGTMQLEWTKNEKASGYRVDLKKADDADFSDSDAIIINSKDENKREIPNLDASAKYTVRIASFLAAGDAKLLGVYSDVLDVDANTPTVKAGEIDPSKPTVALSFDDGPSDVAACEKILDTLEKYGARATFFMVGYNATQYPDNIKRKARLGMELGNHTWDHTHYGEAVTADDIKRCTDAINQLADGAKVTAFRSPGGMTTETILNECKNEGMSAYYWTIDTEDWNSRDANAVYDSVVGKVKDGDIILMHEIYDSTAEAIDKIVPKLIEDGYQIVTCSELIQSKSGNPPVPGTEYVSATRTMN